MCCTTGFFRHVALRPQNPYGLSGMGEEEEKELRSCVKVEVAVLAVPNKPDVDVKQF